MMDRARLLCALTTCSLLTGLTPLVAASQSNSVSLSPQAWSATDSIRAVSYLGRPALYINRGVALVTGARMENGTLDLDVAASDTTNFLGVAFRARTPRFSNVLFLRPGASGTEEAVQYGPAFNSLGVAWQVYHGEGANAVADLPRNRWIHLRVELDGPAARLYVDTATAPTLVVPRVVTSGGSGLGVWAGAFGRGAYFSNIHYAAASKSSAPPPLPPPTAGTVHSWAISDALEITNFRPEALPDLGRLRWQPVQTEPEGFVLINRYREAPVGGVPRDSTGAVLIDSVMTGRVAGSRVVYARTTITSARDEIRRLQYAYSNGVIIYLNGQPLVFAMNPGGLRSNLGVMAPVGDAVYLPLRKGRNQLVFAVIECTGGWAFSARLDRRADGQMVTPARERQEALPDGAPQLPAISEVINGRTDTVTYRGVRALKLVPAPETAGKDEEMLALLDGPDFRNGTIQLEVAGAPRPGMPADSRGFIGLSFRTGPHGAWSELFYLRPTNGRSDDQLRRNHSVQYASHPEFPWHRLRQESPGVYESYADLVSGVWTPMRIEVAGTKARLYVNGATEPCLVINDLKHGDRPGRIALWAHIETDAYFGPVAVGP
jgi:hypothetical protein